MPQIEIEIGGRSFEVACQEGEESFLRSAAAMLDAEAQTLAGQSGRIPEARLLLMAGLMLADRTAGVEDQLRAAQGRMANLEAQLAEMTSRPPPEPERIEVPVLPEGLLEALADLAERAEATADRLDDGAPEESSTDEGSVDDGPIDEDPIDGEPIGDGPPDDIPPGADR